MQPNQRRALFGLILAAGLAWIAFSADRTGASTFGRIPAPQRGFLAPDFTLSTPDGEKVSVVEFRGKPVIINFWATWCPPCRAEMPAIQRAYREYAPQGLVVLGVNSTVQDNPLDIAPFVEKYGLTFRIPLDETGEAARKYQLASLPSTFFIGRDGVIREVVTGAMSEFLLRTKIEEIIR